MTAAATNPLHDFLFGQYATYAPQDVALDNRGAFELWVWYAKQNKLLKLVSTGMISTAIFVYLLWKFALLGDMLINAYYFLMSAPMGGIFGYKKDGETINPIAFITRKEITISALLFMGTIFGVYQLYHSFALWGNWTAYVDTITTAIFFVGMWLMARRKIEHWIFWIVGDIISIPLYFYKGLTVTCFQYIIFTIIAIYGYRAWKQELNSQALA